jgi:hypothetical protein
MKIKHSLALLSCMIIGLVFIQCTLDEGNPGTSDPALTLQAHNELSLIKLEWEPVKVTGFKEYILLQSTSTIPNSPTPPVNQDVTVLTRINEINTTSFATTSTLLSPTSCFKLYCSVDDRFLYSGSVCINQTNVILPGFFDRTDHEEGLSQIAMFDRVNIRLAAVNDVSGTIDNSLQESNLSFPQLDLSTFQGSVRLYSYDLSTAQIRKYSFPELNIQNERYLGETITGGYASGDYIYMLLNNSSSGFLVLNAQSLSTVDTKPGMVGTRNLAVFPGDPVRVMEIGEIGIIRYDVNTLGKVIQSDQFATGVTQPSTQNTCDFNDEYYIGGRFSTIINKEADVVTSLVSGVNAFTQINRFSPDGTKAAIITNNINVVELQVYDLTNLPAALKVLTYNLPNATYADLYYRDNVINVIGVNFNSSSPQTFFLKFPG